MTAGEVRSGSMQEKGSVMGGWMRAAIGCMALWRIGAQYRKLVRSPSDIHQHLPLLRELSRSCTTVCEMGVRKCVSSWAFLMGLAENPCEKKELLCVDLVPTDIRPLIRWGANLVPAVRVSMQVQDSRTIRLIHDFDLLFIDTLHVYGQLKAELWAHEARIRRFICLHDTEVDKVEGEVRRMGWDARKVAKETGMTEEEVSRGLGPALEEFLVAFPSWKVWRHDQHNNGLTVLIREPV